MSVIVNKEMPCSFCQFPNEAEVWSVINAQEDPELKDILLGGELNLIECTSCKKVFYAEHFLLYHDPLVELMAFVYPFDDRNRREDLEKQTQENFRTTNLGSSEELAATYEPVTLFGLDELVQLIEREDEAQIQSDVASYIASDLKIQMRKVFPRFYRRYKLPPLLPVTGLEGVMSIVSSNGLLSQYVEAQSFFKTHSDVQIEWAE